MHQRTWLLDQRAGITDPYRLARDRGPSSQAVHRRSKISTDEPGDSLLLYVSLSSGSGHRVIMIREASWVRSVWGFQKREVSALSFYLQYSPKARSDSRSVEDARCRGSQLFVRWLCVDR